MDFELSPEQTALRDAAGSLLDGYAPPERVREFVGSGLDPVGPGGFDTTLWAAMADQGWLAIERPEEVGGLGLGMVEVAVLCEELGRRLAPAPFIGSILALGALADGADDDDLPAAVTEAAREWSERLSTGEAVGCVAWSAEPAGETDPTADGRCLLTARPEPVVYASVSDVAVVVAGDGVYEVPLSVEDRPSPEPAMDRTRSVAWLRLDRVPARKIGGAAAAARVLDRAVTSLSAELLGASTRVLEMSVDYAKDRVQFGKPIGSFQAVKHRLADALVDVEGMRSNVYYAAWSLASGDPDGSLAASAAKAWCSAASRRVMASGLQVHGGIGFTWEHDLHLYVKRSQLDESSFGDAAFHRERVASFLSGRKPEDPSLF
ncbi:MAG TPA: acyl-CoA dehydrogenase family protein [Acidimicrobiales bacterium]|nr:acyl-CoA dehydrogenase family protein [Acidimicrobiales bacterium]